MVTKIVVITTVLDPVKKSVDRENNEETKEKQYIKEKDLVAL